MAFNGAVFAVANATFFGVLAVGAWPLTRVRKRLGKTPLPRRRAPVLGLIIGSEIGFLGFAVGGAAGAWLVILAVLVLAGSVLGGWLPAVPRRGRRRTRP